MSDRIDDSAIVGDPGEESSDYLLLGAIDPSWCPCDECQGIAPTQKEHQ